MRVLKAAAQRRREHGGETQRVEHVGELLAQRRRQRLRVERLKLRQQLLVKRIRLAGEQADIDRRDALDDLLHRLAECGERLRGGEELIDLGLHGRQQRCHRRLEASQQPAQHEQLPAQQHHRRAELGIDQFQQMRAPLV